MSKKGEFDYMGSMRLTRCEMDVVLRGAVYLDIPQHVVYLSVEHCGGNIGCSAELTINEARRLANRILDICNLKIGRHSGD